MNPQLEFLFAVRFFLTSVIFIIGAYLLQRVSEMRRYRSKFVSVTKNILTLLSVISLLAFVAMAVMMR
jgi:hypothetical protein